MGGDDSRQDRDCRQHIQQRTTQRTTQRGWESGDSTVVAAGDAGTQREAVQHGGGSDGRKILRSSIA